MTGLTGMQSLVHLAPLPHYLARRVDRCDHDLRGPTTEVSTGMGGSNRLLFVLLEVASK